LKIDLENQLAKEVSFDIVDDTMKDVVKELYTKNKILRENRLKNKETFPYDNERLKEEILDLKHKNNYANALIKLLKIQVNKLDFRKPTFRTEKNKDKLIDKVEELYEENMRLKQEMHAKDQEFRIKFAKLQKYNSELVKLANTKIIQKEKTEIQNKAPRPETANQMVKLRLKVAELTEKVKSLEHTISTYQKEVISLITCEYHLDCTSKSVGGGEGSYQE